MLDERTSNHGSTCARAKQVLNSLSLYLKEQELIKMKKDIHPEYKQSSVTCACGSIFQTYSTVGDLKVEICSACHPFFTGKQKLVDSAGRVEKFLKKYNKK